MAKELRIIRKSGELTPYDEYDLTESPAIVSLKNIEHHAIICVGKWIYYKTKDKDGNEIECISIMDSNTGETYSGQSETFGNSFSDFFVEGGFRIEIFEGMFLILLIN